MDKQIVFKLINEVISKINRHPFLKNKDMEEWMAYISKYFYYKNIYVMPIGSSWCVESTKENVENYLNEFSTFFKEYNEWCCQQR